jgi:hypothetical protein
VDCVALGLARTVVGPRKEEPDVDKMFRLVARLYC